jgi:hypothetical protein
VNNPPGPPPMQAMRRVNVGPQWLCRRIPGSS